MTNKMTDDESIMHLQKYLPDSWKMSLEKQGNTVTVSCGPLGNERKFQVSSDSIQKSIDALIWNDVPVIELMELIKSQEKSELKESILLNSVYIASRQVVRYRGVNNLLFENGLNSLSDAIHALMIFQESDDNV